MPEISESIIEGCRSKKRSAQEKLYLEYHGYAMSVSLPYTNNKDDAMEIVNDGFIKAFTRMHQYDTGRSFKVWFRRILINTAIDHFRQNKNHYYHVDVEDAPVAGFEDSVIDKMSAAEIMGLVQHLPPAYKMVFNLYALEGYKHHEIAEKLNISVGTSKSNLAKARIKLKAALLTLNTKSN